MQRGRIEYEGETSVYTQIFPLKNQKERWVYTDLSGGKNGKNEYILIFPGGEMSRGKNEYVTPDVIDTYINISII